jgi:hypothetical protein
MPSGSAASSLSPIRVAASNLGTWALALPALRELNRAGIPFIVFKSLLQVEELYSSAGGRLSTDVDIIVRSRDVIPAIDAMVRLGWKPKLGRVFDWLQDHPDLEPGIASRAWVIESSGGGFPVLIDIHPDSMSRHSHPSLTPDVWSRTQTVERDGVSFQVLCEEDRLIFLCWHAVMHGLDPSRLRDVEHILRDGGELDWDRIRTRARRARMAGMVALVCELVRRNAALPRRDDLPAMRAHQRLFTVLYGRKLRELTTVPCTIFRMVMLDDLAEMVEQARDVFFPARIDIATNYLSRWPNSRDYVITLLRIYAARLNARTFKFGWISLDTA